MRLGSSKGGIPLFTKKFWEDAAERALSTVAQVTIPLVGADTFDLWHVDWKHGVSVIVAAGLLSVAKSIAAAKKGGTLSPASLVPED